MSAVAPRLRSGFLVQQPGSFLRRGKGEDRARRRSVVWAQVSTGETAHDAAAVGRSATSTRSSGSRPTFRIAGAALDAAEPDERESPCPVVRASVLTFTRPSPGSVAGVAPLIRFGGSTARPPSLIAMSSIPSTSCAASAAPGLSVKRVTVTWVRATAAQGPCLAGPTPATSPSTATWRSQVARVPTRLGS